jgi:UDP-2,4-diacetamido-2,4,6-trideoxy-beta-L-altropyranose hydrolase
VSIGTLLIRADASSAMGTGHVMRCLALAQAWQDAGGQAAFAMAESTEAVRARLTSELCDIAPIACSPAGEGDIAQTIAIFQQQNCEWIVVDGYQFSGDYQRGLKASGAKVIFLDDYGHARHYSADVVLNQSVAAVPSFYSNRSEGTRLVLGPRYALLRREFAPWRDWRRTISPASHRLLVTMGSSDEHNVTATAVQALCLMGAEGLETVVLLGGSNSHVNDLHGQIAHSGLKIEFRTNVCNVGELMAQADVAISAAGSTCWELCLLSLPSLLIDIADNQTAVAVEMHKRQCAIHVGDRTVKPQAIGQALHSLLNGVEHRRLLSENSRALVDGRGAARLVSILRGSGILQLRAAREGDCRLLWEWANDPDVRAQSFSSERIPWETHVSWFNAKLAETRSTASKCRLFVAEDEDGMAIGQIRFELRADAGWDVGISLSSGSRGRGVASELIETGVRELMKRNGSSRIHAYVKPENEPSVKSFERARFEKLGVEQVRGHRAVHLIYR